MNVNLAAQYFGGIKQIGQIEFRKLLAKTLIFNSYYDEKSTIHQKRSGNSMILAIVSSCSPSQDFLGMQIITANSKCVADAAKGYVPIACAPQGSIGVQNVSVTILHAPKTIFQHRAEFSHSKTQKIGMPMTINSSRPKNIYCDNLSTD